GTTVPVSFTVTNVGNRATRTGSWTDRVFISRDPSLDSGDFELAAVGRSGVLQPGQSYPVSADVRIPDGISGTFYILAYADSAAQRSRSGFPPSNIGFNLVGLEFETLNPLIPWDMASINQRSLARGAVREFQNEGNNLLPAALPVTLASPPDLQVSSIVAPPRVTRGQPFTFTYTVSNPGGA